MGAIVAGVKVMEPSELSPPFDIPLKTPNQNNYSPHVSLYLLLKASGWSSAEHDPMASKPGVFEHIQEMSNIYPGHDPNWPKHEKKPNLPFERSHPPLGKSGNS